MDDRQSSYFSSGPTPRPDRTSAMRLPSASGTNSRLDQNSRADYAHSRMDQSSRADYAHSRMDQSSRKDHPSAQQSRMNQLSRIEQPSAVQRSTQQGRESATNGKVSPPSKVTQTSGNGRNSVAGKGKPPKTLSSKTAVPIIEEQNVKSTGKKHDAIVTMRKKTEGSKDGTNTDDGPEIKNKNLTYPIPKPPPTRKAEIFKMETAREIDKRVQGIDVESAPDLKALSLKLTFRYYKDVEKVRSIFSWICQQNLGDLDYSRAITNESPLYALKEVKDRKSSYPELFANMCKSVEIPCHVVSGVAKLDNYDIGETEIDQNKVTWNAVYCADGWRIVFFQWAFETTPPAKIERVPVTHVDKTSMSSKGGSFRDQDNGGSSVPKLPSISNHPSASQASRGTAQQNNQYDPLPRTQDGGKPGVQEEVILEINEYYFLTDPDELIYRCFPDDDMWQLLGKPYSIEKFLKLPLLSEAFYRNHLKISSRLSGIRKAKNGSCIISIKEMGPNQVFLKHTLKVLESEEPDVLKNLDLKHLVVVVNEEKKTHFHMRFPAAGFYEFKIYGGESEDDSEYLCSFKVNCEEPKIRFEPLPFVPEIGFGPCLLTERYGLKLVSKAKGLITIRGPDTVDIDFKVAMDVKVTAIMVHHTISSSDLEEFINLKQHRKDLFITVGVPRNGEYVLKIQAKHRRSNKDFINVCNFLLTSEDPKKPRKPFETGADHMVRQQLMDTLKTSKNPTDVQNAIDRLNKEDPIEDGWLSKAYERIEYLKLAKALRNGINRRNADLLDKAIQDAKQSAHLDKLANYVKEGESMLKDADKNPKYILEMKRTTISEIHRYKIPKHVMFDVMKATYLLLGQDLHTLKTWEEIVHLMKFTSRNSLLYRVKQFDKNSVDPGIVEVVKNLLQPHTLEEARAASLGVGTFFQWATDVTQTQQKPKKT